MQESSDTRLLDEILMDMGIERYKEKRLETEEEREKWLNDYFKG